MSLRRLAVENYRCFRDRQELEIHPVTVVLGKNNSGKSALVRAPLILSSGLQAHTPAPLWLERFGREAMDEFTDLIYEHKSHGAISVELEADGRLPFRLAATIQNIDRARDAVVSSLDFSAGDNRVRLAWVPVTESPPHRYEVRVGNAGAREEEVAFRGLLPAEWPAGVTAESPEEYALGRIRYLSAHRAFVQRHHRLPFGEPYGLHEWGDFGQEILAHDRVRRGGALIDIVNRHLAGIVPDWQLDEVSAGPLFSTVLRRQSSDTLHVNLADAGAGVAQVLPILVQCGLDELAGASDDPPLQVIEEPETHLHPAAHAELADIYLKTAAATGTRFLIETHSETLLLRLRRRIAERNEYSSDMVGIYVVDQRDGVSTVRRVSLDDLGNLGDQWPEGYFSQDYHEVRALASAQVKRTADAG